jgi:hypothetical protein
VLILYRLLNDNAADSCGDVHKPDIRTDLFFKEMLLTYRLLFSQDEKSCRAFLRMAAARESSRIPVDMTWASDPLLFTICGKSSASVEVRNVFDEIDCSIQASTYTARTEFPFLGQRLLELQEFAKRHQAHDLITLFRDRRDMSSWITLWSNQVRQLAESNQM